MNFTFGNKKKTYSAGDDILLGQQHHEKFIKPKATNLKHSLSLSWWVNCLSSGPASHSAKISLIDDDSFRAVFFVGIFTSCSCQGLFEKLCIVGY